MKITLKSIKEAFLNPFRRIFVSFFFFFKSYSFLYIIWYFLTYFCSILVRRFVISEMFYFRYLLKSSILHPRWTLIVAIKRDQICKVFCSRTQVMWETKEVQEAYHGVKNFSGPFSSFWGNDSHATVNSFLSNFVWTFNALRRQCKKLFGQMGRNTQTNTSVRERERKCFDLPWSRPSSS